MLVFFRFRTTAARQRFEALYFFAVFFDHMTDVHKSVNARVRVWVFGSFAGVEQIARARYTSSVHKHSLMGRAAGGGNRAAASLLNTRILARCR